MPSRKSKRNLQKKLKIYPQKIMMSAHLLKIRLRSTKRAMRWFRLMTKLPTRTRRKKSRRKKLSRKITDSLRSKRCSKP